MGHGMGPWLHADGRPDARRLGWPTDAEEQQQERGAPSGKLGPVVAQGEVAALGPSERTGARDR